MEIQREKTNVEMNENEMAAATQQQQQQHNNSNNKSENLSTS